MADYRRLERQITEALGLNRRPVAVTFAPTAPAGVRKFSGTEPAGCAFWRLAERGGVFYTEPGDHYNCAVGCFTHSIALPAERASEMDQTLAFMMQLGYLKTEDLAHIAQLRETPRFVAYAPLGDAPVAPDVVLFAGKPSAIMLLNEAALRAGVGTQSATLGRPTCMALPAALDRGVALSTGCVGNRIYTEIGDDELYVAVRGADVERVAAEAETIANANARLADYHRGRRQELCKE
ncbi:MAG: DUF169 domain-containing protein [Terriglobales bacterium]